MTCEAENSLWSNLSAAMVALLLSTVLSISSSHATDAKLGSMDDFWEKYDDIANWVSIRLELKPEQEEKVLPLMEKNFQSKLAVMKEYGIEPGKKVPELTSEQKEEIDAKMIAVRAETRAKVVGLLNEKQLEELKQIQKEYHQELREQLERN